MIVPGLGGCSLGSALTPDTLFLALFVDFSILPRAGNLGFQIH